MSQSNVPPIPPAMPGYPSPGAYPPPPSGNGFAVASLICSILGFCVFFLGGLLGVIFGLLGLRRAREPGAPGKGLAIAGIVIGVLSLITSGLFAAGGAKLFQKVMGIAGPMQKVSQQYVTELQQGNIDAAMAQTTGLSREEVESQSAAQRAGAR